MSVSHEVTEKSVTVTANAPEAEIREGAGFAPVGETPPVVTPPVADVVAAAAPDAETVIDSDRNADGTFKPKADVGGDPRKSFQAKINEERRLRGDAERRATELEAKLAAGTSSSGAAAGKPAPVDAPKPPTYLEMVTRYQTHPDYPQLDDFVQSGSFDDPYHACAVAQAAFLSDARDWERSESRRVASERQQVTTRVETAHREGAEKYPDWQTLFDSDEAKVDLPAAVINELYNDTTPSADLIHHLLTHPDELRSLATVEDPIAAARLVARLSANIPVGVSTAHSGPESTPPKPPVTRAKPLIKPVSASPSAPDAVNPDDLPFGPNYVKLTAKQDRAWKDAHRGV
jgi:hypothetical protein